MPTDLHVRLPDDLRDMLAAEAKRQGISLNALITIALRDWAERKADPQIAPAAR